MHGFIINDNNGKYFLTILFNNKSTFVVLKKLVFKRFAGHQLLCL